MITARVNPHTRMLTLTYPHFSKKGTVQIPVRNYDEASQTTINHIKRVIAQELHSWYKTRLYIYSKANVLTPERANALERLHYIITHAQSWSLHKLTTTIANSRVTISTLMPRRPSPALTYFDTHVVPILQYCTGFTNT